MTFLKKVSTVAKITQRLAPSAHRRMAQPCSHTPASSASTRGIVSKRRDSSYRSGRSPHWIKSKNPDAPAVKREVKED
jgi:ATP-dependent DNA ligase